MLSPCSRHMTSSKGGVSGVVRLQGSKKKEGKVLRTYCDDCVPIPTDSAELQRKLGSAAMSISWRNGAHLSASLLPKPRTRPHPTVKVVVENTTEWTPDLSGVQQRGWLYRIW